MSGRGKSNVIFITSVVMGIISAVAMGIAKGSRSNIPIIKNIFKMSNIGMNSIKDFLEISDLNYRLAVEKSKDVFDDILSPSVKLPTTTDIRVEWDSDGSQSYTIYISSEELSRKVLFDDSIPILQSTEIEELKNSSNWTRRILIGSLYTAAITAKTVNHKNQKFCRAGVCLDSPKQSEIPTDKKLPVADLDICGTEDIVTTWEIPFTKFHSRIKSLDGRCSNEIIYPSIDSRVAKPDEITSYLTKAGRDYILTIKENDQKTMGSIHDYKVCLYMGNNKGKTKKIPKFESSVSVNLGSLKPCICFITGIRDIGESFKQYVTWIDEEKALTLDEDLQKYLDQTSN